MLKAVAETVRGQGAFEDVAPAIAAVRRTGDLAPLRALVAGLQGGPVVAPRPDEAAPAASPAPSAAPAPEPAGDGKAIPRVLRVDQSKIDAIMDLVAELIVAKNGLSYLATRAEKVHGSRAAL